MCPLCPDQEQNDEVYLNVIADNNWVLTMTVNCNFTQLVSQV